MKRITVYEAIDYIKIGEGKDSLNSREIELLDIFIKKEKLRKNYISWEVGKFKFINYVGIITLNKVTIEILPKTRGLSKEDGRKSLINMLIKSKIVDVNYSEMISVELKNENLLEILAYLFSVKLKKELNRGLYKEYVFTQDNLSLIRGKVNFKEQQKNKARKIIKTACEFEEFTENNLLNGIFKSICCRLVKHIRNLKTLDNLNIILSNFSYVELKELNNQSIEKIKFNRNNKRYYESFLLMKKLLFGQNSMGEYGKDDGFCLLFEVNNLYEKYIGKICKSIEESTLLQNESVNLVSQRNEKGYIPVVWLKPDIYIPGQKIIMDTKWKLLKRSEKRFGVQVEDLYQMFAYHTRYEDVKRVILIYPLNDSEFFNGEIIEKFVLENNILKSIEIVAVDIRSYKKTIEGIRNIIMKTEDNIYF